MNLDQQYWEDRWDKGETGWDIGYPSPALSDYFNQLDNKELKILVPGGGNAYEVEYLHQRGFTNVYLLDISKKALESFHKRYPDFPEEHLIHDDFFSHEGEYDLIVEQTFFCALDPSLRQNYCLKMLELLKPGAKIMGLLFNAELNKDHPPFGGFKQEYEDLFSLFFNIKLMEEAHNSIKPRESRELFIIFEKTSNA